MTGELLLIALAVLVTAGLLTPAGRHLVRTIVDLVDGSLALYSIRRTLGLDTTTRRERRIARRRAAEQTELERRIGIGVEPAIPTAPVAVAPNRLVASGEPPEAAIGPPSRGRGDRDTGRPAPLTRRRHLLDAAAALAVIVVALVGVNLARTPSGAVLEATGRPAPAASPGPVSSVGPVGTPAPVIKAPPSATPTATSSASPAAATSPGVAVAAPTPTPSPADAGPADAGRRGAAAGITGFRLLASTGGAAPREVETLPPNATSVVRTIPVGEATTFRLRLAGDDVGRGPVASWPPISPGRHQETSRLIDYRGAWRSADGPSLSGAIIILR